MANITFHRIKTLVFDVFGVAPSKPNEIINFETNIMFGVSRYTSGEDRVPKLVIRHSVIIGNVSELPEQTEVYGRIETECQFNFPGLDDYFNSESGGYRIPKEKVVPLLEAAVSTTRGIMIMRGAGTPLDSMPLPLVNGMELLKNETVDINVPQKEAIEAGLVTA